MAVVYQMLFGLVLYINFVESQINSLPNAGKTEFYLDKYSDCDGRPREVYRSTVSIFGTSTAPQGQTVTSCSITLSTESGREPYRFKLQVLEANIKTDGVYFYIYDGEFNGKLLFAFSKANKKPGNMNFIFTTGQLVTFRMTRGNNQQNFGDIRIIATPVPSEIIDCNYGNEHNCDEYGYNYRLLGTKEIAGIIAGCFALVFLIVIIVVVCCYRKQKGISRKWKEEKLGHVNTAASLHSLNGKVPHSNGPHSTKPWTSESSKQGFASIRRSPNLPRAKIARSQRTMGSDSSMFDSNASLPVKRPLPPPQVSVNPRGTSERSGRRYRDKYERYEEDEGYSDRSFSTDTKNFSERNYKPPTYREALRNDSESSADEHTFVGADDSGQQSVFVERVMAPRNNKKMSPQVIRAQRALPPPDQDTEYDSIEPKTKKALLVDKGAGSGDETPESDTENESEEESEEETESEAESEESEESEKEDKPDVVYSQPNKVKNKQEAAPPAAQQGFRPLPHSQPQQFQPGPVPQGVHQPKPRFGYPGQAQPYPAAQHQYPQGQPPYPQGQPQYPMGQPQYPPQGQYPPMQQPNQSLPNSYHQANFTVPLQSGSGPAGSQYPTQSQSQAPRGREHRNGQSHKSNRGQKDQMPPSNPPVYSYLVNRGYKPTDGRYSPVSTSTGASNLSGDRNVLNEDSDFSANLGSGVELMKRK